MLLKSQTGKLLNCLAYHFIVLHSMSLHPFEKAYLTTDPSLLLKKKRQYKLNVLQKVEESCGSDPIHFWQVINGLPSAQRNKTVKLDTHEVCDQIRVLSDIPHQNFFDLEFETQIKAFLDNCDTTDYDKYIKDSDICDILNENVKIKEIEYALRKLKVGKSPGIDGIPVEFIKESIDIIKYDLQHLFNYVLSCEKYPDE